MRRGGASCLGDGCTDYRTFYEVKKSFRNYAKLHGCLYAGRGDLPIRDLIPLSLLRASERSGILLIRGRLGRVGLWHMWLHERFGG
jgi:hypothetical protein